MSMFSWVFKSNAELGDSEIPSIYPLSLAADLFIKSDILNTYLKILSDTAERAHGLEEKQLPLLYDSCLQSDSNQGLITMLAEAMSEKKELFIVYSQGTGVIRKATQSEQDKIRADYKKAAQSTAGVFVSFKEYKRTDMLKVYSNFEYCILGSLNKTLNLSKAVQIKISDLRSSVGLADSGVAKAQALSIGNSLKNGNDVLLDAKDTIETATPDTSSTEKAILFLDAKRAFILGLPLAYINGEQTGGIGASGEQDMRAVERGLKQYFVSIIRPVFKAVFGKEVEFKSQDFREMNTALETLKTFDVTSEDYLSSEAKKEVLSRMFDLDRKEEEKNLAIDEKEAEKEAKLNPPLPIDPNAEPKPGTPKGNGAFKQPGANA